MRRREALAAMLALGAATAPGSASAQVRQRSFRIGLIPEFDEIPNFRSGLSALFQQLGWRESVDFDFIVTGAKYHTREIEAATARMVGEKPDLILVAGTSVASALHRRTHTIPIVMVASGYPVEAGLANTLALPGKNVTGTTIYAGTGVWAKYLELLRAAKPGIARVGMLMSYTPPGHTREEIEPQPLLIYAPELVALWRSALSYAVRILRDGARPGDLPFQQPAKFELAVNLKTAGAIGLAVPQSLLLRADRVIQ